MNPFACKPTRKPTRKPAQHLARALSVVQAPLCALLALLAPLAHADPDSARNKGAAWLLGQQRGDGSWANANGELSVQATSTALLALKNAGLAGAPTFASAAAWLANAGADSIDSIARKVEALSAAGLRSATQNEADRLYGKRTFSTDATWGGYGGNGVDHIDTALGLTALRVGDAGYAGKVAVVSGNTIAGALCALAGQRIAVAAGKQAWPVTQAATNQSAGQGRPSVVATALLLNELRATQLRTGFNNVGCPAAYSVLTVLAEAQAWLLDQQNTDGGFGEQRTDGSKGNSSVLVTAWVYRALNAQAAPPAAPITNARNWLLGQQDAASGSWHADPLVTAAVVAVLPAAAGAQLADTDRDGITDVVEQQIAGSSTTTADARNRLGPPSLAVPGVTIASFTASATAGQPFSTSLGGTGGFALTAGSLPPGVGLDTATGLISGTPQQAGNYSFEYTRTSSGNTELILGRIDVASGTARATQVGQASDGDVPIPGWALAVLAASLLAAGRQRKRRKTGKTV